MNDVSLPALILVLIALVALSAFFSGSETGLMMVNRYRLQNRAKAGQPAAQLAQTLLQRPDRLIGMILLCNTAVNISVGAISTIVALRISGTTSVAVGSGVVTSFVLLIFGEVTPKTLAALYPERVALTSAFVYAPLLRLLYPLVFLVNLIANGVLRVFGVTAEDVAHHSLSAEELRAVVAEAAAMIPQRHQRMLLSILDLERATVEDIMIPRNEIVGLDLSGPWEKIRHDIVEAQHTLLPLYDGSIDDLRGTVHLRRVVKLAAEGRFDVANLVSLVQEPYFIPEGTPLNQQLLNFQDQKRRIGFVVDEYGDIQGLVTLEDILEEVVGEFTSDPATRVKKLQIDADGSVLVHGSATIRSLNRTLGWKLPQNGPKTINGLILEKLEELPAAGKRIDIGAYQIEITDTRKNVVKTARVRPYPATASELAAARF